MIENSELADRLAERLIATVGAEKVSSNTVECATLSGDLFPDEQHKTAAVVVCPVSVSDVADCVKIAREMNVSITPRGGGMSYTGGYRPNTESTILLDMRGLDAIREINSTDRYAVVDAGCTWAKLKDALDGSGLRSSLRGPISGSVSTVGGAASQNLPGSMNDVLGLEVVTADGSIVRTGSFGVKGRSGFYRNFGPDLTGLFLGDVGAFGVKTAVVLRLEPIPEGVAHASFGFESMAETVDAMTRITALNLGGRMFALDPLKNKTSTKVSVREGVDTLKKVVSTGGLKRGLLDAAKIAVAGKNAYDNVAWSLHLTVEGASQRAAEDGLMRAKEICRKHGSEIEPSIPVAMHAGGFSIRGFLGIKGERWAPLHALFPLSKANDVVKAVEAFSAQRAEEMADQDIVMSYMLAGSGSHFLIEPMFYWPDKILDIQRTTLDERRLKKLTDFKDNPTARHWVRETRLQLRDLLYELGGMSTQIGRFYPYRDALEPETQSLLHQLKNALDSNDIMNPGALGLSKDQQ